MYHSCAWIKRKIYVKYIFQCLLFASEMFVSVYLRQVFPLYLQALVDAVFPEGPGLSPSLASCRVGQLLTLLGILSNFPVYPPLLSHLILCLEITLL